MIKLFEALVAKAPKKHAIDFFCNKLFAAFAPPTAVSVSSAAEPTSDAAEPTPDATEPIPNAADGMYKTLSLYIRHRLSHFA